MTKSINVVMCQYNPILKQKGNNFIAIANMLKNNNLSNTDIIIMPELGFTGSTFDNTHDAIGYAEEYGKGVTYEFLNYLSKKYNSYIFAGYLEKDPILPKVYISMMVLDRNGNLIKNYRKKNLFKHENDVMSPGKKLDHMYLEEYDIKVGLGICYDIGYKKTVGGEKINLFAEYMRENNVKLIVHVANIENYFGTNDEKKIEENMLNGMKNTLKTLNGTNIVFISVNRIGSDAKGKYVGTSSIIKFETTPKILAHLNTFEQNIIQQKVNID